MEIECIPTPSKVFPMDDNDRLIQKISYQLLDPVWVHENTISFEDSCYFQFLENNLHLADEDMSYIFEGFQFSGWIIWMKNSKDSSPENPDVVNIILTPIVKSKDDTLAYLEKVKHRPLFRVITK